MESIQERFLRFNSPNYFSRVDRDHSLELHIGLDEKARKSIELRAMFVPRKITGTTAIEINQYHKNSHNTLRFSLTDDDISGLFFTFCEDLIEQTKSISDSNLAYEAIINRFFQWKKLFVTQKKKFLSESEIMGLIGELLFIRLDLQHRIGLSAALKSWSGQDLTHKDFSCGDKWYEVKTITRSSHSVRISSLEQLDSDRSGELIVFSLEKMSENYNGIKLNKIILEMQALFGSDDEKEEFLTKVAIQGYEYNDYYDDYVYELVDSMGYIVNENFPKLTRQNVPAAITKAAYDISLQDIAHLIITEQEGK